jgi:hypothetical protein
MHSSRNSFNATNSEDNKNKIFDYLSNEFTKINDNFKSFNEKSVHEKNKISSEISGLKTTLSSEIIYLRTEIEELKEQNNLLMEVIKTNVKSHHGSSSNSMNVFTIKDEDNVLSALDNPLLFTSLFNEINTKATNFALFR